eukprot:c20454_g1_i1 orf=2-163(-)
MRVRDIKLGELQRHEDQKRSRAGRTEKGLQIWKTERKRCVKTWEADKYRERERE